jgi:class 3 adenylate cyclase
MTPEHSKPDLVVLFADICRSVTLFEELGDDAATLLVRRALELASGIADANQGKLIRTKGDDVLCTFASVEDAFRTAQQIHAKVLQDEDMFRNQVSFRVGMNVGPFVESGDSIFGDTVNVAARLVTEAKAHQSLLSGSVARLSAGALDDLVRPLGGLNLRGKSGSLEVYELLAPTNDEEITEVSTEQIPEPRSFLLSLNFQAKEIRLNPLLVRYLLGRGQDCDLIVNHPTVSREHAEIRFKNGRFMLRDFSTNGTHVTQDGETQLLHRSSLQLRERGTIFLGRTPNFRQLAIKFNCIDSRFQRR